jgi:hypothetical protein
MEIPGRPTTLVLGLQDLQELLELVAILELQDTQEHLVLDLLERLALVDIEELLARVVCKD